MINDFDLLLNKCKTRARKRVLRITLRVLSSIVLVVLGVLGYYQWQTSSQPINVTVAKPAPTLTVQTPKEENITLPSEIIAQAVPNKAAVISPVAPVTVLPVPIAPTQTPVSMTSPVKSNRLLEVSNASSNPITPEQTYQRAPKFETALAIARDFYSKEDYVQAAVWAKKANQMNREAEEAWLLYAKSYYAQGKKNEAIGVLELFLNYKDSKAAADLIKSWR